MAFRTLLPLPCWAATLLWTLLLHLLGLATPGQGGSVPLAFGQPTKLGDVSTLGYDLAGRINAQTDAAGRHTRSYVLGRLDVEAHPAGALAGQTVDRGYNGVGRFVKVTLSGGMSTSYTYRADGAPTGVTTAGDVSGIGRAFDPGTGCTLGLLTTSTFDGLGRPTAQASKVGATSLEAYAYSYDEDGHCAKVTGPEGGSQLGYDGNGYLQTVTGGRNFAYTFDEAGRAAEAVDYRPTLRQNEARVDLFGSVTPAATLTINGVAVPVQAQTGRFGQSYAVTPGTWQSFTVRGTLPGAGTKGTAAVAEEVREVFVPPQREALGYDASGNRTSEARWSYTWNGLEQLTRVEEKAPRTAAAKMEVDYLYDLQGRRVEKKVKVGGTVTRRTTTLWDGWCPVLEVDHPGATGPEQARRIYTWGPEVSGSLAGAAGIGGLLEVWEQRGTSSTRSLPLYDGEGNVVGLVDASTGARVATYRYGPFGEVVEAWGERAGVCPFRFQTKLYEPETGQYYFGKRYYDPGTHTWLSRDPLREAGGINLYAYCGNDPVGRHDPVGLEWYNDWGDFKFVVLGGIIEGVTTQGIENLRSLGDGLQDAKDQFSNVMVVLATDPARVGKGLKNASDLLMDYYSNVDRSQYLSDYQTGLGLMGENLDTQEEVFHASGVVIFNVASGGAGGELASGLLRGGSTMQSTTSLFGRTFQEVPALASQAAATAVPAVRTNFSVYETLVEVPITGASRRAHRVSANSFLANQLGQDAELAGFLNRELGTDVFQHMKSGKNLLNPPGAVWHHPFENPGVMRLLRVGEHTNPALQPVLHPGPGGIGGFGNFYGP